MFDKKSRYEKIETYKTTDRRGRTVIVVSVPPALKQAALGLHIMKQGQRLDHLAHKYLDDPAGYWRICEMNDAMLTEALTEAQEIAIPRKKS